MDSTSRHLVLLLVLSGLLFFLGLGTLGLTDRDEGSNAEAAREMVETGSWLTPTLNYEPRFAKPVLVYWLMSATYRTVGISEFAARLPSAVFGMALILLQYWFVRRVSGPAIGFLAALMLLVNIEVVAIGRLALTDSVLMFFSTVAVYGFWLGIHGKDRERHYFWLFYVGMALGMLTKGPVGVLVPLLAVVPYLTLTRRWREFWQQGFPIAGTTLFVMLAMPWYAAMLWAHGSRYTTSVQGDTVGRFFTVIGGHSGTVLFYVPVLLFGFFPWSGFLPVALYHSLQTWRRARAARLPQAPHVPASAELEVFAAFWLLTGLLFFSLSATRLPHYIGPLFPAAAIVTATFWHRALAERDTPGINLAFRMMMGLGYLLGLALLLSPFLYNRFLDKIVREFPVAIQVDPGWGPYAAGVVLLLGMALIGYYGIALARRATAFWISAGLMTIVLLIVIEVILPHFSRYFISPPQELAYTAGLNLGTKDRLILYGPPKPSLLFYAQRGALVIRPDEEDRMRPHLQNPAGRTMILLPSRLRSRLPSETASYQPILERFGYTLLANEPMVKTPSNPQPPAPIPGH